MTNDQFNQFKQMTMRAAEFRLKAAEEHLRATEFIVNIIGGDKAYIRESRKNVIWAQQYKNTIKNSLADAGPEGLADAYMTFQEG